MSYTIDHKIKDTVIGEDGSATTGKTSIDVHYNFREDVSSQEWKGAVKPRANAQLVSEWLRDIGFVGIQELKGNSLIDYSHEDGRRLNLWYSPFFSIAKRMDVFVKTTGPLKTVEEMFDVVGFNKYLLGLEDTAQ
jgi:hypothetical protein